MLAIAVAIKPEIPAYSRFLPGDLLGRLWETAEPVAGIDGLRVASGLREEFPNIETDEALEFVRSLYLEVKEELDRVLEKRIADRDFIDRETLAWVERNGSIPYSSPGYETVIGKKDGSGRIVVGPLPAGGSPPQPVEIPDFLKGDQVTLFGPPDTAKMSINAMNAFNRVSPNEPAIVTELAEAAGQVPRWGAHGRNPHRRMDGVLYEEGNPKWVSRKLFEEILAEELEFLKRGEDSDNNRIQVKWKGAAEKWYPVATEILRRLVTDPEPVEFATEFMLPFTFGVIRDTEDPIAEAKSLGAF